MMIDEAQQCCQADIPDGEGITLEPSAAASAGVGERHGKGLNLASRGGGHGGGRSGGAGSGGSRGGVDLRGFLQIMGNSAWY